MWILEDLLGKVREDAREDLEPGGHGGARRNSIGVQLWRSTLRGQECPRHTFRARGRPRPHRSGENNVWGRIDGAEGAVEIEGGDSGLEIPALGENDLEDISGGDVFLGAATLSRNLAFGVRARVFNLEFASFVLAAGSAASRALR